MDFSTFKRNLRLEPSFRNGFHYKHMRTRLYHIILHQSKFEYFLSQLNEDIIIMGCSRLWRNDHIHLIVHLKKMSTFILNFQNIPIESIDYVYCNYIQLFTDGHDLLCNFSVNLLPLQTASINVVLKNLNYLHNMPQLNVPKVFYEKCFEQSQEYSCLPQCTKKDFKINAIFPKKDCVYKKDFVAWIQQKEHSSRYEDLVTYYFVTPDNKLYNGCLNCMNFKTKNFTRKSFFSISKKNVVSVAQHADRWCRICKQVSLFYVLNWSHYEFYNHVQLEYYEDGQIVKTFPRRSNRIKKYINV